MTGTQWTIDDFSNERVWLRSPRGHRRTPGGMNLTDDEFAALVADVAAARLVDDMAAVVRRLLGGWRTGERCAVVEAGSPRPDPVPIWMHGGAKASDYESEPMSPGEVAALHHARQQEPS